MGKGDEQENCKALEPERDEHCVLTAYMIRHPAEEGTCEPIQDAIQRQSEWQGGHGEAEQRNRTISDFKVFSDWTQLRRCHQPAHGKHRHHDIEEIKTRSLERFCRCEVLRCLRSFGHDYFS